MTSLSSSSSPSDPADPSPSPVDGLEALRVLLDLTPSLPGNALPLPPALARLYGPLTFPIQGERAHVFANFVTSLDGVVSLETPGMGGGEISGFNAHDRMLMGLLRAAADAVVVGAGTLRAEPEHIWTAAHIYSPLSPAYASLRAALGKPPEPLSAIVTGSGNLNFALPVFQSGAAPVLVVTTAEGLLRIARHGQVPASVRVAAAGSTGPDGRITAHGVLAAIRDYNANGNVFDRILLEGGPHLLAAFLADDCLDDLFLTLAPQLAGREAHDQRLALIEGKRFAPQHGIWTRLVSVRQAGSHLFLRYALAS